MKKNLLAIVLALAGTAAVHAQTAGVTAGVNLANIDFGSSQYSTSMLPGFHAGVYGQHSFSKNLGIQAELQYSTEGAKEKLVSTGTKFTLKETFLQIPVMVQYLLAAGLHIETGPQVGIVLSMKETNEAIGQPSDIKQYYKSTDLRWALGAGYRIGAVPGLGVHARYSLSLTKLNDKDIAGNDLKNRVFQIGLNYALFSKSSKK